MRYLGDSNLLLLSLASRLGLVNAKRVALLITLSGAGSLKPVLILLEVNAARDAREALRGSMRVRRKPHPLARLYWRILDIGEVRDGRLTHLEYTVYTPLQVVTLSLEDELEVYRVLREGAKRFCRKLYELICELIDSLDDESISKCLEADHCVVDTIASILEAYAAVARVAEGLDSSSLLETARMLRDARRGGDLRRIFSTLDRLEKALKTRGCESLGREAN